MLLTGRVRETGRKTPMLQSLRNQMTTGNRRENAQKSEPCYSKCGPKPATSTSSRSLSEMQSHPRPSRQNVHVNKTSPRLLPGLLNSILPSSSLSLPSLPHADARMRFGQMSSHSQSQEPLPDPPNQQVHHLSGPLHTTPS